MVFLLIHLFFQGEQLNRVEAGLDNINADMKVGGYRDQPHPPHPLRSIHPPGSGEAHHRHGEVVRAVRDALVPPQEDQSGQMENFPIVTLDSHFWGLFLARHCSEFSIILDQSCISRMLTTRSGRRARTVPWSRDSQVRGIFT